MLSFEHSPETFRPMVWFYERQGAFIRCETRTAPNGVGFELVVIQPDGSEQVEHFDDSATLGQASSGTRIHAVRTTAGPAHSVEQYSWYNSYFGPMVSVAQG